MDASQYPTTLTGCKAHPGGRCPGHLPANVAPGPPAIPHARPQQTGPDPTGSGHLGKVRPHRTSAPPSDAQGSPGRAAHGSGEGTATPARAPCTSLCPPHRTAHAGSAGRGTRDTPHPGPTAAPPWGTGMGWHGGAWGPCFSLRGSTPPWLGAFLSRDLRVLRTRAYPAPIPPCPSLLFGGEEGPAESLDKGKRWRWSRSARSTSPNEYRQR